MQRLSDATRAADGGLGCARECLRLGAGGGVATSCPLPCCLADELTVLCTLPQ